MAGEDKLHYWTLCRSRTNTPLHPVAFGVGELLTSLVYFCLHGKFHLWGHIILSNSLASIKTISQHINFLNHIRTSVLGAIKSYPISRLQNVVNTILSRQNVLLQNHLAQK